MNRAILSLGAVLLCTHIQSLQAETIAVALCVAVEKNDKLETRHRLVSFGFQRRSSEHEAKTAAISVCDELASRMGSDSLRCCENIWVTHGHQRCISIAASTNSSVWSKDWSGESLAGWQKWPRKKIDDYVNSQKRLFSVGTGKDEADADNEALADCRKPCKIEARRCARQ